MSIKNKIETVQEYIMRGGAIEKIPVVRFFSKSETIKQTGTGGPIVLMSLDEADLFYGEARKGAKPKKIKESSKIDLKALPENLRVKYINRLKEEMDVEFYEEDEDED